VVVNGLLLRSKPEDVNLAPWGTPPGSKAVVPDLSPGRKTGASYKEILSTPRFWMLSLSYFFISATLYTVLTFMIDYARYELHFPYEKASLLATANGIGQIAGVLTIPFASDYLGRRLTIIITNICIGAAILGIILSGSREVALFVSIGFFGAFFGATFPMYGACGGDYFRKEIMGTVIGAMTIFYGLGAILAHRFSGHMRDITGSFFIPFMAAVIMALLSAVPMLFLKRLPVNKE
jgi:OFA family oxalate/formate antiporter-like MFS transporter